MKPKQLVLTFVVTAVFLALVFFMISKEQSESSEKEKTIGQLLFKDLPVNEVVEIKIKGKNNPELRLLQKDETWNIASLYGYPADFNKIRDFISELAELKNTQNVEVGKSQLSRLGLDGRNGDGTGILVELLKKDGSVISSLILGKEHKKKSDQGGGPETEFPDGRYLMTPGKDNVYLVDKTLNVADSPSKDWANRDFISAKDLRTASLLQDGAVKWKLYRNKKEEALSSESVPEGSEIDKEKASSISNALYAIRFASVADPALKPGDTGLDSPSVFKAETFSGKNYELMIGKESENSRYVKINVSFTPPKDETSPAEENKLDDPKAKEEKEKKAKQRAEEIKKYEGEARNEQELYGKWIYLIADSSLKPVLTSTEELFKKIGQKEDPKKGKNTLPPSFDPSGFQAPPMPPPEH